MTAMDALAQAWQRWAWESYRAILPSPVARLLARTGVWPDVQRKGR